MTALESAMATDPGDLDVVESLIAVYMLRGRAGDALALTQAARAGAPDSPGLELMEALAREMRSDTLAARDLFRAYVSGDRPRPLVDDARGRLARIERDALRLVVRGRVTGETQLPLNDPGLVAVMPPSPAGDGALDLSVALSDLLARDVALTGELRTVDRAFVAAALAEIAPDPATWADPAIAERIGRLTGARLVVYGQLKIADDQLAVGSMLMRLTQIGSNEEQVTPVNAPLIGFYEATRQLVPSIYTLAGIELDADDLAVLIDLGDVRRAGGEQRENDPFVAPRGQTAAVDAWILFGEGLRALDAGSYAAAGVSFEQAVALDPNFAIAREHTAEARRLAASFTPPGEIAWRAAHLDRQLRAVQAHRFGATHEWSLRALADEQRALLAEITGQGPGSGALVEIEFEVGGPEQ
jgi:hypothetical protein